MYMGTLLAVVVVGRGSRRDGACLGRLSFLVAELGSL